LKYLLPCLCSCRLSPMPPGMSPNSLQDYEMTENAKESSNCEATTGVARASMVASTACLFFVAASSEISPAVVHSSSALKVDASAANVDECTRRSRMASIRLSRSTDGMPRANDLNRSTKFDVLPVGSKSSFAYINPITSPISVSCFR